LVGWLVGRSVGRSVEVLPLMALRILFIVGLWP
jgi:hypothetical protein